MKKTVYIHIGTHKTGTTAIQVFSTKNIDKLKEMDVLYPHLGRPYINSISFGHHLLPWYLSKHPTPNRTYGNFENKKDLLFPSLIKTIQDSPYKNVVLSSEEFDRLEIKEIKKLKTYFKDISVKIIVYLRRKDTFIESLYQTKVVHSNYYRTIEEVIKSRHGILNYYKFISKWQDVFGKNNVIVNLYCKDKLKNNDIIADFYSHLKIDISNLIEPKYQVNASVPYQYVALIANLGRKGASQNVINILKRISKKIKNKDNSFHFLTQEKRMALADSGFEEIERLSVADEESRKCFLFSEEEIGSKKTILSPLEKVFLDFERILDERK